MSKEVLKESTSIPNLHSDFKSDRNDNMFKQVPLKAQPSSLRRKLGDIPHLNEGGNKVTVGDLKVNPFTQKMKRELPKSYEETKSRSMIEQLCRKRKIK